MAPRKVSRCKRIEVSQEQHLLALRRTDYLESHRENLREDPDHAAIWRRLITETKGDARYWAVMLWLCGGR